MYVRMYSYTYVCYACIFTAPTYNLHSVLKAHNMSHMYVCTYVSVYIYIRTYVPMWAQHRHMHMHTVNLHTYVRVKSLL